MLRSPRKIAVITGAASGIGEVAHVIAFAVGRPVDVSLNEILIRPTGQAR